MSRRRYGFTLVEILVVTAIIGVLVALMLPAIQAAREQARRCQCQNHMSQLILAVHNYETLHGIYPPGTIEPKGPILNAQIGYHHNWVIQILPYMEYTNTWEAIDKRVGVYHVKQLPPLAVPPGILDCPSCPAPEGNPCYAGVHHDVEKPIDANDSGMFFLNSRLRIENVPDGLAQTLFLGEKLPDGWDLHWMSGTRATLRNTGAAINSLDYRNGLPRARSPLDLSQPGWGWDWADETTAYGPEGQPLAAGDAASVLGAAGMAEESGKPKFPTLPLAPALAAGGPGNPLYVGSFSSDHPNSANFAFGDGSVRLITEFVELTVLQQLANRRDGKLARRP